MLCLVPPDAVAQFGSIFGDPPPRPPSNVPGGRQPQQQQIPQPQFPDRLPPGPPPSARRPQPPIQTEPLSPRAAASSQAAPGLPAGVRPPRGTPAPAGDDARSRATRWSPLRRRRKFRTSRRCFPGLDKITGRIISFDVTIGETVQFGALQVVPRVCYTRPADRGGRDRLIRRSERSDAAGRGAPHLLGLDVRGEPGSERRRASDL